MTHPIVKRSLSPDPAVRRDPSPQAGARSAIPPVVVLESARGQDEDVVEAPVQGPIRFPTGPGIEKAHSMLGKLAKTKMMSPPAGYKGGSAYTNVGGRFPRTDEAGNPVTYKEWDVNPLVKGVNRGTERILTGTDGSAYYTDDHYKSFLQFWGPGQ